MIVITVLTNKTFFGAIYYELLRTTNRQSGTSIKLNITDLKQSTNDVNK